MVRSSGAAECVDWLVEVSVARAVVFGADVSDSLVFRSLFASDSDVASAELLADGELVLELSELLDAAGLRVTQTGKVCSERRCTCCTTAS